MIMMLARRAALPAALLVASPLAAQDELPRPASGAVEVQLTVEGAAEVPAQGYRVGAYLNQRARQSAAGSAAPDGAAVIRQLEASEIPERDACSPSFPYGFVGNELAFPVEDAPDEDVPAESITTLADALNALPQSYSGLFGSREAAEEAQRLLRPHAGFVQIQPVLFDCAAANEAAAIAALRKSRTEIETLARALGLRNAGVTRIEKGTGDQAVLVLSAMRSAQSLVSSDTVQVPTALQVTFRLER